MTARRRNGEPVAAGAVGGNQDGLHPVAGAEAILGRFAAEANALDHGVLTTGANSQPCPRQALSTAFTRAHA